MKYALALLAALAALCIAAPIASAGLGADGTANPYACSFAPDTFDATCDDHFAQNGEGTAHAAWNDDGTILGLTKDAPTSALLVAGALVNGFSQDPLFELSFDVRGYCGAGAPRFNVYETNGVTDFFGCQYGTHTDLGDGWTHVDFTWDCTPGDGSNGALCFDLETATPLRIINGIELIQDEQGTTELRNISVNDILIGKPADTPPPTDGTPGTPGETAGQVNRAGYCTPQPVPRTDGTVGRFVDLEVGGNFVAPYKGAVPAFELKPSGAITCELPAGYVTTGQVDGLYPIAIQAGASSTTSKYSTPSGSGTIALYTKPAPTVACGYCTFGGDPCDPLHDSTRWSPYQPGMNQWCGADGYWHN